MLLFSQLLWKKMIEVMVDVILRQFQQSTIAVIVVAN